MFSVEIALAAVLDRAAPLPATEIGVEQSLGAVLAEEVVSDVDSPPHDKAMVDGYAVVAADLASGRVELAVVEEITAGRAPLQKVSSGSAARIMTGSPVPDGADAVVMIERTERLAGDRVRIEDSRVVPGQNIMRRAASLAKGSVVLRPGDVLNPSRIGVLSEVGRASVLAIGRPTVAVLATGDELVPPDAIPGPAMIRNSNGPMLVVAAQAAGATPRDLGIARDDRRELAASIERGLNADILVLSGGVSMGDLDLVPGVLAELGVEPIFHKVRLKPGKPMWFGARSSKGRDCLVFGLPGNPVSSLVCFHLFVQPAIRRLAGRGDAAPRKFSARLAKPFRHRGDRPTYFPATLGDDGDAQTVEPVEWKGSADLRGFSSADALVHFPAGDRDFIAGESVETFPLW